MNYDVLGGFDAIDSVRDRIQTFKSSVPMTDDTVRVEEDVYKLDGTDAMYTTGNAERVLTHICSEEHYNESIEDGVLLTKRDNAARFSPGIVACLDCYTIETIPADQIAVQK